MKIKKLLLLIMALLTLLCGCNSVEQEPVYHVVNDAGEEVASFKLSQIKAGMTRREIMDMLVGPWKPMMYSGIDDRLYRTMMWGLSDGLTLQVHFENDVPIREEIYENEDEYNAFWLDHFKVKGFSLFTPLKKSVLPEEWTDGSRTISDEECALIKQGITFEQVRELIGNPSLIPSVDLEHKMVTMDWNLNSQYSFQCFRIEFEVLDDTINEKTLIVKNFGRLE